MSRESCLGWEQERADERRFPLELSGEEDARSVAGTCGSVNAMEHQLGWYREMTFAPCRAEALFFGGGKAFDERKD